MQTKLPAAYSCLELLVLMQSGLSGADIKLRELGRNELQKDVRVAR